MSEFALELVDRGGDFLKGLLVQGQEFLEMPGGEDGGWQLGQVPHIEMGE